MLFANPAIFLTFTYTNLLNQPDFPINKGTLGEAHQWNHEQIPSLYKYAAPQDIKHKLLEEDCEFGAR